MQKSWFVEDVIADMQLEVTGGVECGGSGLLKYVGIFRGIVEEVNVCCFKYPVLKRNSSKVKFLMIRMRCLLMQ